VTFEIKNITLQEDSIMWLRITTLSIAFAIAGAALAQQNDDEAKRAQESQKLGEEVKARMQAERASRQAELARVEAEALRAQAELERAEAMRRMAMDRDAAVAANREVRRYVAARPTKKEMVTYCGISTAEPPPVLIEQLKLTRGIGLVVDFVEPGSPAETAGLKQYDVITKLNDQILSNSEQLGVLVRLKKPSDDANLEVIRQGKTSRINVELGKKEMEVEVEQAAADPNFQPRAFTLRWNGDIAVAPPMMGGGGRGGGGGGVAFTNVNVNGNNQTMLTDDQNTITLDMQNGKATKMTARDNKTGQEIFNGPVETDAQRSALPPELADKLKKAEEGGGPMRFAVRGARAARAKVLTSTERDTLLIARFENGKATHAFAFSTTDGKTLFDGPTVSDEQRKSLPEAVAKQLETIEKNQDAATEFGVIGRN